VNADARLLDRLEGLSWLEPEKRNVFAQKLKLLALKSRSQIFVTGTSADQAYVVFTRIGASRRAWQLVDQYRWAG
jgi:hypothetical protein